MGGWMQGSGRLQQSGQLWTGGGQGRNGQRRKVGHTRPVTTGQSLRKSLAWPEHPPALTQMSASRDFPAPSGCPFFPHRSQIFVDSTLRVTSKCAKAVSDCHSREVVSLRCKTWQAQFTTWRSHLEPPTAIYLPGCMANSITRYLVLPIPRPGNPTQLHGHY